MRIQQLTTEAELQQYESWVKAHPQGSLWQSLEWKKYQESLGRETRVYACLEGDDIQASALVVIDKTAMGLSTWDVPRGPLMKNGEWSMENIFDHIISDAKQNKCLAIYFSPQIVLNYQFSILHSDRHEQPEATRILDLKLSDDDLLAQMHQKGRYNIKVAQKNEVLIKKSDDIDAYYELAKKTGGRDSFTIASREHYKDFLTHMKGSFLMLAYIPDSDQPVAGLIGVTYGETGIYYYGASDYEHRALMAPYLLQWEAIQYCKKAGCTQYDLLGIAPPEAGPDHPWAGISSFKEKFGGTVITYPPEQQITLKPVMQMLLKMKRKLLG